MLDGLGLCGRRAWTRAAAARAPETPAPRKAGEAGQGGSACHQRSRPANSGDGGEEGVQGGDLDVVQGQPLHPRKTRKEELHFPAGSAT